MIICLDYGERFIGVAMTDSDEAFALRHGVIDQKTEDAMEEIQKLVEEEGAETILVGMPRSLSGEETEQTHDTQEFVEDLQDVLDGLADVKTIDETFTSKEAERVIRSEGGDATMAHAEAARLMLEMHLQHLSLDV